MSRFNRTLLVFVLLSALLPAAPAVAEPDTPVACTTGTQASGALYQICTPAAWNQELAVYAHGYVSAAEPLHLPPEAGQIQPVVNLMGYAFATTSYSTNGLAVKQGVADLLDLVDIFATQEMTPTQVYLIGASEGGVITTLSIEGYPQVYSGGLAMCGPIGDFAGQVDHFGDFRVVFDYFFPDLLPGTPISIPQTLTDNWATYALSVTQTVEDPANASLVDQLLAVTGAAYDPQAPSTKSATIEKILWYNVFATNDAQAKLGGQPFDNQERVYAGSLDDAALNAGAARFSAAPAALQEITTHYQTSGELSIPLITMHTTGDPVVPYWHLPRYRGKTIRADNMALNVAITVERYGHCLFTPDEILAAFNQLVNLVKNPPPYQPARWIYLPMLAR